MHEFHPFVSLAKWPLIALLSIGRHLTPGGPQSWFLGAPLLLLRRQDESHIHYLPLLFLGTPLWHKPILTRPRIRLKFALFRVLESFFFRC